MEYGVDAIHGTRRSTVQGVLCAAAIAEIRRPFDKGARKERGKGRPREDARKKNNTAFWLA